MTRRKRSQITIGIRCQMCNQIRRLVVWDRDFDRYRQGKAGVQECFPYLAPGDRKLLISRICDVCSELTFK